MVTRLSDTVVDTFIERQFRNNPNDNSGLNFVVQAGILNLGSSFTELAQASILLTDASVNVVYIDTADPANIASDVLGGEPSASIVPLFQVTTAAGSITSIVDNRTRALTI